MKEAGSGVRRGPPFRSTQPETIRRDLKGVLRKRRVEMWVDSGQSS